MIGEVIAIFVAVCASSVVTWLVLRRRPGLSGPRDYSSLKHHAKVHTFRFSTMVLAWIALVAIFVFYPKYIAQSLRALSHGIEYVADMLPEQWGSYVEIVLRELGGLVWLQITAVIILIRFILSGFAIVWRYSKRHRQI
jgi:hypothetical protein